MDTAPKPSRLLYIDNLRVFTIALVVLQHAAVTYSGLGSWYYKEAAPLGQAEFLFFGLWQSHAQAFFMSLFFLVAGYFVPASFERKGPRAFLLDRLYRLGVPLLVYVFVLHPLLVKILHPDLDVVAYVLKGLRTLDILSWTGPLWFVETLLLFTVAALPFLGRLRCRTESPTSTGIPATTIWALVALITAAAFGIRLACPIGTSFANLQFCYFAAYIVAFAVGLIAGARGWLDRISYRTAKRWLLAAFGIGVPLWLCAMVAGGAREGRLNIDGGMAPGPFLYALWESFFCVAFIVALLGIAREKFNFQKPWMRFLADNTFGVYVFHAIVLVLVSLALKPVALPAIPKFALVSLLALTGSFLVAWAVRQIPPLRRLFS
jgi:peptidoglycan/LPS O-acetylase OafA/YrhL